MKKIFILLALIIVGTFGIYSQEKRQAKQKRQIKEERQIIPETYQSDLLVDAHVHLNDVDMQLQLMEKYSIQKAVIFWGRNSNNESLLKATLAHPDKFIPFVSVSPERRTYRKFWENEDSELVKVLEEQLKTGKFKGIGEISVTHFPFFGFPEADFSPTSPLMKGIMKLAEKYKVPINIHCEITKIREFSELLNEFKNVKVIWAHGGYTPYFLAKRMLENHPNLTYELSARTWLRHPRSPEYTIFKSSNEVWSEWLNLIEENPTRFVVGTDASHHSLEREKTKVESVRLFLNQLSPKVRKLITKDNLLNLINTQNLESKAVKTDWNLSPSFKFDTLCFLNVLTGDPYYLNYYKDEYEKFKPTLTPQAKKSLANLKRIIKDENKNIISAFLSLYFSATDDETLEDMLKTLEHSEAMRANLKKTPYYNEANWKMYELVKPDLKVIFQFLQRIKFDKYWEQNILPKVADRIIAVEKVLPKYDVISKVENHLGYRLSSNKITVYMLHYSQPHGIKITGTRFLTDVAWSFGIVLRNAVHEMMHPPFEKDDKELFTAIVPFKKDKFVMDKILNHNPAFGYNSFEGYIEENIVQAVEQIINEKLGIAVDAREKWKTSDDGMHVFAAALYSVMKDENFPNNNESLREFLLRIIRTEKFSAGKVKIIYDSFYEN